MKDVIVKLIFSLASALKFTTGTLAVQAFVIDESIGMLFGAVFFYLCAIVNLWMVFD